jgi:hypothetical protein
MVKIWPNALHQRMSLTSSKKLLTLEKPKWRAASDRHSRNDTV